MQSYIFMFLESVTFKTRTNIQMKKKKDETPKI